MLITIRGGDDPDAARDLPLRVRIAPECIRRQARSERRMALKDRILIFLAKTIFVALAFLIGLMLVTGFLADGDIFAIFK